MSKSNLQCAMPTRWNLLWNRLTTIYKGTARFSLQIASFAKLKNACQPSLVQQGCHGLFKLYGTLTAGRTVNTVYENQFALLKCLTWICDGLDERMELTCLGCQYNVTVNEAAGLIKWLLDEFLFLLEFFCMVMDHMYSVLQKRTIKSTEKYGLHFWISKRLGAKLTTLVLFWIMG